MLVYSLVPWQLAGVKGDIFVGIFTNWLLLLSNISMTILAVKLNANCV